MAFPSIRSQTASGESNNTTSHTITYPGTITAGDTLLCFIASDGDNTFDWAAAESSRGWVKLYEVSSSDSQVALSIGYIKASGSETGTFELTSTSNEESVNRIFSIQDTADPTVTAPDVSAANSSTGSTTVTFNTVTPAGGSKDYLWFAAAAWDDDDGGMTDGVPGNWPVGYDANSIYDISGTGAGTCSLDLSWRTNAAASESPGDGEGPTAEEWVSAVVGVHPVGTGATPQAVDASATSTAVFVLKVSKTLAASATGTAILVKVLSFKRTLAAGATGTASLLKKVSKTLTATATGTAILAAVKTSFVVLVATATGTATLAIGIKKKLAASATGTAVLVKKLSLKRILAASAVGTAILLKKRFLLLPALVTVTTALVDKLQFKRTLSAVVTGTATLAAKTTFKQILAAVASTVATLATVFTPGGGGPGPITFIGLFIVWIIYVAFDMVCRHRLIIASGSMFSARSMIEDLALATIVPLTP